jgi:hypothetical protein
MRGPGSSPGLLFPPLNLTPLGLILAGIFLSPRDDAGRFEIAVGILPGPGRILSENLAMSQALHEVVESPPEVGDKGGMTYRLSPESLRAGIAHLSRYGDTDIFPHLPELSFFADEGEAVVAELAKLDLDTCTPAGAAEALVDRR